MELIYSFPEFQTQFSEDSLTIVVSNPKVSWRLETLPLRVFGMLKDNFGHRIVIDLQTVLRVDDAVIDVLRTIHQISLHDSREVTCLVEGNKISDELAEYAETHSLPVVEPDLKKSVRNKINLSAKAHFQLT